MRLKDQIKLIKSALKKDEAIKYYEQIEDRSGYEWGFRALSGYYYDIGDFKKANNYNDKLIEMHKNKHG